MSGMIGLVCHMLGAGLCMVPHYAGHAASQLLGHELCMTLFILTQCVSFAYVCVSHRRRLCGRRPQPPIRRRLS